MDHETPISRIEIAVQTQNIAHWEIVFPQCRRSCFWSRVRHPPRAAFRRPTRVMCGR